MTSVSAPGKLFLTGEYAVLEGAPAILAALPQRSSVTVSRSTPGMLKIITADTNVSPLTAALPSTPLLQAVIDILGAENRLTDDMDSWLKADELSLTLDTSAFFRQGGKLGLGSSAALTVALVKALTAPLPVQNLVNLATECHMAFQGGLGSGADIAVAAMDCDIVFTKEQPALVATLPADLFMLFIWTGIPASSTQYLSELNVWRKSHEQEFDGQMAKLLRIAERSVAALQQASAPKLVDCIADYNRALAELSAVTSLNFYSETHVKLRKQVESANCTYKPSGAGGGDFGIAFSTNQEHLSNLFKTLEREERFAFFSDAESWA